jgi:DnaJ-class molecular chaperone
LIINIPKGVNNDTLLKVSNIGNYTKYGYSDVYIRLNVSIDSYFERKQDDIFTTNYIPLSIALLGGQVKVLGLYSSVEVNIPAGSVDNSIVKLKGLGVNKKGDHYVRIKVILPKSLNDEQRNIFEQIAKYEV